MESEPSLACVGVLYLWRLVWTQCPGYGGLRGNDRAGSETGGQSNHQPDGQADIRSQADAQHWIITYWCTPSDRRTDRTPNRWEDNPVPSTSFTPMLLQTALKNKHQKTKTKKTKKINPYQNKTKTNKQTKNKLRCRHFVWDSNLR